MSRGDNHKTKRLCRIGMKHKSRRICIYMHIIYIYDWKMLIMSYMLFASGVSLTSVYALVVRVQSLKNIGKVIDQAVSVMFLRNPKRLM